MPPSSHWTARACPRCCRKPAATHCLAHLLRVPHLVFAINKLDALEQAEQAFPRPSVRRCRRSPQAAGIAVHATVPMSALLGYNVVSPRAGWCGYTAPACCSCWKSCPCSASRPMRRWRFRCSGSKSSTTPATHTKAVGRFWGALPKGASSAGQQLAILPSGQSAVVAQVLNHVRVPGAVDAGHSAGIVLDREVDVSRGDWLLAADDGAQAPCATRTGAGHRGLD